MIVRTWLTKLTLNTSVFGMNSLNRKSIRDSEFGTQLPYHLQQLQTPPRWIPLRTLIRDTWQYNWFTYKIRNHVTNIIWITLLLMLYELNIRINTYNNGLHLTGPSPKIATYPLHLPCSAYLKSVLATGLIGLTADARGLGLGLGLGLASPCVLCGEASPCMSCNTLLVEKVIKSLSQVVGVDNWVYVKRVYGESARWGRVWEGV